MKVGTILNTQKIAPLIFRDLFDTEMEAKSKVWWLAKHSPTILLAKAGKLLNLTNAESFDDFFVSFSDQIEEFLRAGAMHLELSLDMVRLMREIEEWWRRWLPYLESLKERGVTFSVHLPQFAGFHFDSYLDGIRNGAVAEMRIISEFLKPLDPYYVLHLGGERFFRYLGGHVTKPLLHRELTNVLAGEKSWPRVKVAAAHWAIHDMMTATRKFIIERVVENTMRTFEEVGKFLPLERICLENLEHIDLDEVMALLMPRTPVSMWLDTGHLMIQRWHQDKHCFEKFFKSYSERLAGVHIHNVIEASREVYRGGKSVPNLRDHQPLDVADGLLPLEKVLKLIKQAEKRSGRNLPLVAELYYHDPLPSVKFLKQTIDELDLA